MGLTDNLFLPAINEIVKAYVGKWGIEKVMELTGKRPSGQINSDEVVKLRRKIQDLQKQASAALDQTEAMLND